MKLENLIFAGSEEANKILREMIEKLPEGTITGLNAENQRMVYANTRRNEEVVGLRMGGWGPVSSNPISVNIPNDCAEENRTDEYVYFRFINWNYTIYFR